MQYKVCKKYDNGILSTVEQNIFTREEAEKVKEETEKGDKYEVVILNDYDK